jgi:hypothetical protein
MPPMAYVVSRGFAPDLKISLTFRVDLDDIRGHFASDRCCARAAPERTGWN